MGGSQYAFNGKKYILLNNANKLYSVLRNFKIPKEFKFKSLYAQEFKKFKGKCESGKDMPAGTKKVTKKRATRANSKNSPTTLLGALI